MKRSTKRILTTHTGSLPRPPELVALLEAKEDGRSYSRKDFDETVRAAVADIVGLQVEAGIDIISDGEQSKPSFATYVKDRLSGFDGVNPEPRVFGDRVAFPEWNATTTPSKLMTAARPMCTNELGWKDREAVATDIENFRAALGDNAAEDAFLPSASLGIIAEIMLNRHYPSEEAYLYALADVMKVEY
ncbi:MAG: epoxyalkane--coenzyme M transferase, partial [Chloroflexi bacterium]|nr:epoxyalkane--coenzyme M transferase [Chloroflexota bacterium]